MNIEDFYQNFLESDHKDGALAVAAINSAANETSAQSIADGIEEEMHSCFVSGFIAGINFMKGALR